MSHCGISYRGPLHLVLAQLKVCCPVLQTSPRAQCYKVVPALFERQLRKSLVASQRVNVLYAVHKVLRSAKKQLRNKSRY
ncbi:hypothetical protein MNEG_1392, partial [Monoraphidium neglectum]